MYNIECQSKKHSLGLKRAKYVTFNCVIMAGVVFGLLSFLKFFPGNSQT